MRRCERKTENRSEAECLFFTLGPKQVGRAAIVGWRDVFTPSRDMLRFWPFDGSLEDLLRKPGVVVAEIYPREAYSHLDIDFSTRLSKKRQEDRQKFSKELLQIEDKENILLSEAAKYWIREGFESDDDFDAMVG